MMDIVVTEQLGLSLERASFLKKRSQLFLAVARTSALSDNAGDEFDDALSDDHAAAISDMGLGEEVNLVLKSLHDIEFAMTKLEAIDNGELADVDITVCWQDAIALLDQAEEVLEACCCVDPVHYASEEIEWEESNLFKEDEALFADEEGGEE
ncbi:MAG: hypothetical protein H6R25_3041 [Proteobacteria bacterium]|nr:hypothetical protein [Pseudomonadota bacterium]